MKARARAFRLLGGRKRLRAKIRKDRLSDDAVRNPKTGHSPRMKAYRRFIEDRVLFSPRPIGPRKRSRRISFPSSSTRLAKLSSLLYLYISLYISFSPSILSFRSALMDSRLVEEISGSFKVTSDEQTTDTSRRRLTMDTRISGPVSLSPSSFTLARSIRVYAMYLSVYECTVSLL